MASTLEHSYTEMAVREPEHIVANKVDNNSLLPARHTFEPNAVENLRPPAAAASSAEAFSSDPSCSNS